MKNEHHLIDTLNTLVVKLKKDITDTNRVKDMLRTKNLQAKNWRDQLRMKFEELS